jgi:predicted ATPase
VNINDIGQVELEVVEGNTSIPARLVSEGTLRLLGLLSLSGVKEPASVLGFEEPENGVQPGRIDLIAKYLTSQTSSSNTQFIVTTHSPVLADRIPPDSLYMCQKRDGFTSVLPLSKVSMGPLAAEMSIQEALKENPDRSISTLMLRGDLDA